MPDLRRVSPDEFSRLLVVAPPDLVAESRASKPSEFDPWSMLLRRLTVRLICGRAPSVRTISHASHRLTPAVELAKPAER